MLGMSTSRLRVTLPCGRRDDRFSVSRAALAVNSFYSVNISLVRRGRSIDVLGGICADGCYRSPSASASRSTVFRRQLNLITAFDNEIAFIV